jgi:hypothetical protein
VKIIVILFFVVCIFGCVRGLVSTDRALEFTKNIYAGKSMQAEEWLTKDILTSKLFVTFGSFDALVNESAAEAKRNDGLQAIKILKVTKERGMVFVEVEVVFNNSVKSNSINPWVLEDGKWKITKDKKDDDSFK